jgi:hypothetical protein
MKVYIVFTEENDVTITCDGDEAYHEWKNVVKVVDTPEKAINACKAHSLYSWQEYEVE